MYVLQVLNFKTKKINKKFMVLSQESYYCLGFYIIPSLSCFKVLKYLKKNLIFEKKFFEVETIFCITCLLLINIFLSF